ncbi:ATP-binding protein [Kitasatospora purpeofusca]|uniref:ATP-binding protein n=1 Tax=Kitasatospora purpeofusca TaxID=67352 RepID=A0ABZ1TWA0_9ACTN|nr:ATP-binding protein [Kitasatospora purpeofusca]
MKSEIPLDDPTPRAHTALLSSTPKGAAIGRRMARQHLTSWELNSLYPESFHSALIIVAELAANASIHGRTPGRGFELSLSLTSVRRSRTTVLRIEVSDCRGDKRPVLPDPRACSTDAQSGRGLTLVDALADRWGTLPREPNAKTVWAELDLPDGKFEDADAAA